MKKIFLILVILLVLGGAAFYIINTKSTPQNIEVATISEEQNTAATSTEENTTEEKVSYQKLSLSEIPAVKNLSFTFTGYGPAGKFHDGSFKNFTLSTTSIIFKSDSVDTKIDGLNKHLCAADFFDCQKYPEIKFEAVSVTRTPLNQYEVVGNLFFKDIKKQITFSVSSQDDQKFNVDFLLDTSEFGFNPALVDSKVRIRFSFEI